MSSTSAFVGMCVRRHGAVRNVRRIHHIANVCCRRRADEARQAHALVARARLLLVPGGGALARQGHARALRAAHHPQAAEPETGSTPDDRCSSDDSWEVVEAYPVTTLAATSSTVEEADVLYLVQGAWWGLQATGSAFAGRVTFTGL